MDDPEMLRYFYDRNKRIAFFQIFVALSSRSDPGRALVLYILAKSKLKRFSSSARQEHDLEQSIFSFTEAIFLPPLLDDIVQIFYNLTVAILIRARKFRRPEDVNFCLTSFRYLRVQRPAVEIHHRSAMNLILALEIQVESDPGDAGCAIEEMAGLCDEILDRDIPMLAKGLNIVITSFARTVHAYLERLAFGQVPSGKVIGCLRKATMRLPDLHIVTIALAESLHTRRMITPFDDDYKEVTAILDKLISFNDPDNTVTPDLYKEAAMSLGFLSASRQHGLYGKPEDLEQAIHYIRRLVHNAPRDSDSQFYAEMSEILSNREGVRFKFLQGLPIGNILTPSVIIPSYHDLSATLHEIDRDDLWRPHSPARTKILSALERDNILQLADLANIKDGIHFCQHLLASYPGSEFATLSGHALVYLLKRAFECTNKIEYLNEAISICRRNTNTTDPQLYIGSARIDLLHLLVTRLFLLSIRLGKVHPREDLDELMQLFPIITKQEENHLKLRFLLSGQWALVARAFGHHSASTAYDHAMSSTQASLTLAPTVDVQHSQLNELWDIQRALPLDYASYQVHNSQLEQAIETLERGRALLWSELRGFRTSIDRIRLAEPQLAEEFATINKDLEKLTFSHPPCDTAYGGDGENKGMDPTGNLVLRQRKLLDDRNKLISKIQALPGLDTFLKSPSFDALCSAASHGPVIIVNHNKWRSDVIILLHNASPSLIPISHDFYPRAIELKDRLLEGRGNDPGSNKYQDALRSVLSELYDLVGRSVIRRLKDLKVPEQSRVWWCPTSVLCSLPLHAMGPIPSEEGPPRYFLDLYIPSYTPTLSSLIESRKPGSQTFGEPSMLLVVQPDESMKQALKEMKAVQAICPQTKTLIGKTATPTQVLERLQNHQFVHVVCHGILEPGKPFDSSFKLSEGKSLSLLDISRHRLPNAEFAFLAACHTAELTDESVADEALHLAAAMQYCGFRSVVGTMWAMADTDGPKLAKSFYASVFSDREGQDPPYYERTAKALRDAVVELREKVGSGMLERWVNYVHYGA